SRQPDERKDELMKRLLITAALLTALALVGPAAAGTKGQITIRHQTRGCHTWSYNGGPFTAALVVRIHRGTAITVTDNDVMPHTIVQTAGAQILFQGKPLLNHMGAQVQMSFPKAGAYAFK